jgi:hypothetical protein
MDQFQQARPPIDQGGHRRAAHRPDDKVTFPISQAAAVGHDGRAVIDALVWDDVAGSAFISMSSAFA